MKLKTIIIMILLIILVTVWGFKTSKNKSTNPTVSYEKYNELNLTNLVKREMERKKDEERKKKMAEEKKKEEKEIKKRVAKDKRKKAEEKKRKREKEKKVAARKANTSKNRGMACIIKSLQPKISDTEAEEIAKLNKKFSKQYGLDPYWMLSIMYTESGFSSNVVSSKGARGLMQLIPSTARNFGVNSKEQLSSPKTNINVGFKYYRYLLNEYNDTKMATIAYNQGTGNVSRGTYRTWYYDKVIKNYKKIIKLKNDRR